MGEPPASPRGVLTTQTAPTDTEVRASITPDFCVTHGYTNSLMTVTRLSN